MKERYLSTRLPMYKRKGDPMARRRIILLEHGMKVLVRVLKIKLERKLLSMRCSFLDSCLGIKGTTGCLMGIEKGRS